MKNENIRFRQSVSDFPLTVSLGGRAPVWGLDRWGSGGLRFVPPDDGGFVVRGDSRRLVYRGRKRSHRFTVLGDSAFEYDCILEKEPDTNVVSLRMEGAGGYDFFRQPDFLPDPLLSGSYAVYKKETLLGEGTGKLCHIYRPLIIDALGRRCWGDLSVAGERLEITIPEDFLSGAAYPVVVDPTVGTATVGGSYLWNQEEPDEEWEPLYFETMMPVNRFMVPEKLNGTCTAFIYTNDSDGYSAGRAVVYSDNGNTPLYRRSKGEALIDFEVSGNRGKGWRSGAFQMNTAVDKNLYVWFGVCPDETWFARFDYGAKCYRDFFEEYGRIPDTYPLYNAGSYSDLKLSMYFTFSSAQNYTRTLTQGVKLTDSRKGTANYKRSSAQTVKGTAALSRFAGLYRRVADRLGNSMTVKYMPTRIRAVLDRLGAGTKLAASRRLPRMVSDAAVITGKAGRFLGMARRAGDRIRGSDTFTFKTGFVRSLRQTAGTGDRLTRWGKTVRCIRLVLGSKGETERSWRSFREVSEGVLAAGPVFRGLLMVTRIVSRCFVRDYLLGRFLRAREELVVKSVICRELVLESRIN